MLAAAAFAPWAVIVSMVIFDSLLERHDGLFGRRVNQIDADFQPVIVHWRLQREVHRLIAAFDGERIGHSDRVCGIGMVEVSGAEDFFVGGVPDGEHLDPEQHQ